MDENLENRLNESLGMSSPELDAIGDDYDHDRVTFTDSDVVYEGSPIDQLGSRRDVCA